MIEFTKPELEAIYTIFDRTNVNGIESNELKLAVMKKAHAAIQGVTVVAGPCETPRAHREPMVVTRNADNVDH